MWLILTQSKHILACQSSTTGMTPFKPCVPLLELPLICWLPRALFAVKKSPPNNMWWKWSSTTVVVLDMWGLTMVLVVLWQGTYWWMSSRIDTISAQSFSKYLVAPACFTLIIITIGHKVSDCITYNFWFLRHLLWMNVSNMSFHTWAKLG